MSNAYVRFATQRPTQKEKALPNQVENNAGGYVFQVSDVERLKRFLLLGTVGGTYYQSEQDLTKQNVDFIKGLIHSDPELVIDVVHEISSQRRALRQSPAIFVAALILEELKHSPLVDNEDPAKVQFTHMIYEKSRFLAKNVCKTATMLFELISYIEALGGWSKNKRRAVAGWYENWETDGLAFQLVKYRQRNGVTHADAIRLSKASVDERVALFVKAHYNADKNKYTNLDKRAMPFPIRDFEALQAASSKSEVLSLLDGIELPAWELLPTRFLKEPEIWKKLFYKNGLRNQALIRNVTRLARIGAFDDMHFARDYADKLVSEARGLHPLNFLNALLVHEYGQVNRKIPTMWSVPRTKDWDTCGIVKDALNTGFYESFKKVAPSNKRILLALDVSSSMGQAASGLDMSCSMLTAAMAMAIARVEKTYMIRGFTDSFKDLGISASDSLDIAVRKVEQQTFGSTDCAQPMLWATKNKVEIDTFVVLTDSDTHSGVVHPYKALEEYRQKMGINAGEIVVGATATPFTIANPADPKTLDVVGADSNLPALVSNFC